MRKRQLRGAGSALLVIFLAISVTACEGTKGWMGALTGAAAGGVIGSQFGSGAGQLVAVAIGTLAGAWAGNEIEKLLDHGDKMHAEQTAQTALERNQTGAASPWNNEDSQNSGTFMPTSDVEVKDEQRCRMFTQTVTIDGEEKTAQGIACQKNPRDVWRVVSYE